MKGSPATRYLSWGFSKDEPPMTPWAQERFKATKPSFGGWASVVWFFAPHADVLVPDLRGFGQSSKPLNDIEAYSRFGQARAVAALMDELSLAEAVLVGYDIGGYTVQTLVAQRPDLARALVIAPPLPGAGRRILAGDALAEYWHASLYQTRIVEDVLDGNREAIRALLAANVARWQGPGSDADTFLVEHLTETLSEPGAFTASVAWFRNLDGNPVHSYAAERPPPPEQRITVPTTILWPTDDPLFPFAWSDNLDDYFTDYELIELPGSGHFAPLEAPDAFATHILAHLPPRNG